MSPNLRSELSPKIYMAVLTKKRMPPGPHVQNLPRPPGLFKNFSTNVPRKEKKFRNFCKNSFRSVPELTVSAAWTKLSAVFQASREVQQKCKAKPQTSENQVAETKSTSPTPVSTLDSANGSPVTAKPFK